MAFVEWNQKKIEAARLLGLKEGVVYMPVPRCDSCRYWKPLDGSASVGSCDGKNGRFYTEARRVDGNRLFTRPDFGCVEWKEQTEQAKP